MRWNVLKQVFLLFVFSILAFDTKALVFLQNRLTKNQRQSSNKNLEVPFLIFLNSVRGEKTNSHRQIFLLLEPKDFSEDKLKKLFAFLSKKNNAPKELHITAFSDKKMLKRAVVHYQDGLVIEFKDTPKGQKAASQYALENLPLKSGYFRAYYHRSENDEHFEYSPDWLNEDLNSVQIKVKTR